MSIAENVKHYLNELAAGNCFHERVTLLAATKTRTPEEINEAIEAGITDIGENKVQEFRDKFDLVRGANRHFIGHLQTNKLKYLVGRTHLIHSLDRDELMSALSAFCEKKGVVQDVLIEVNVGSELSKSGYSYEEAFAAYERAKCAPNLRVRGFMAMLPLAGEEEEKIALVKKMRALFDRAKQGDENITWLSMGMSGDWRLCVAHGANMVRIGTALFGERHYPAKSE